MDLDFTVIIQLFIVLSALIITSQILAKPFLRAILERETRIEGAKGKAAKLEQEAKEINSQCDAILNEKRQELSAERNAQIIKMRGELQTVQHDLQEKHLLAINKAKEELSAQEAASKSKLADITAQLSDQATSGLLNGAK